MVNNNNKCWNYSLGFIIIVFFYNFNKNHLYTMLFLGNTRKRDKIVKKKNKKPKWNLFWEVIKNLIVFLLIFFMNNQIRKVFFIIFFSFYYFLIFLIQTFQQSNVVLNNIILIRKLIKINFRAKNFNKRGKKESLIWHK